MRFFCGFRRNGLPSVAMGVFVMLAPAIGFTQDPPERQDPPPKEGPKFDPSIEPPDCLVLVEEAQTEIEKLRFIMGKPKIQPLPLQVKNAAPREVFFQALTLFRKADQLCYEQTRERRAAPEVPQGEIKPGHVAIVINGARERLKRVLKSLDLEVGPVQAKKDDSTTPSDVFLATVRANRQLNVLLDHQFTPSDVFQNVTTAVAHAARILQVLSAENPLPPAPSIDPGKTPADVYLRLFGCYQILKKMADDSNALTMADITIGDIAKDGVATGVNGSTLIEPSDVYDIASLVVSELNHLHAQFSSALPPRRAYYPGRKFPSHVYQRAGILEAQLKSMEPLLEKNFPESGGGDSSTR